MTEERSGLPELPQGWVWTTIDEIGELLRGVSYKKPEASKKPKDGYVPVLRANNINYGLNFDDLVYVPCQRVKDEQLVRTGDIVICMSSGSKRLVGKAAQARNDFDGGFGAFCGLVRVSEELEGKYVGFFFQSPLYRNVISRLSSGVNINNLRRGHIESMPLPLAPLSEQQRIVAKIEELFTQLDAGVAALEKAKAQLRRYRQAVLKAAVEGELTREWRESHQGELEPASVLLERILEERRAKWEAEQLAKMEAKGKSPKNDRWKRKYKEPALPDTEGLPELPEGWCYTSLAPLLSMHRSGMKTGPFGSLLKKHEHRAEGVPVLGIENVEPMRFVRGNKIHVTEEKAAQLSAYDVQANDMLISRSGTVGQVCVVPEGLGEARMSTNLMRVVLARDGMLPHFFSLLFNGSPFVLAQVSELCSSSTRDFLNQKILSSVVFSVPPLAEQQRIVSEVERRLSVADEMEKTVEQSLKRAERLRQSILKRAFEGKLVPQDPSDEPASVLLERIKAGKARREAERKSRKKGSRRKRRKTGKAQQVKML